MAVASTNIPGRLANTANETWRQTRSSGYSTASRITARLISSSLIPITHNDRCLPGLFPLSTKSVCYCSEAHQTDMKSLRFIIDYGLIAKVRAKVRLWLL